MTISMRLFRISAYLLVLGAFLFGLTASALAWDQPLRVRQFGTAESDYASGVATDAVGNVYVTGSTAGSLGGPNRGGGDAWLAKYNVAGRVLWKRQLGTTENDDAVGVSTDARGNVYLTGTTRGSLGGFNRGEGDVWLAKYDPTGRILWKRQLGTKKSENARGLATDAAGNVYLAGHTDGSLGGPYRGNLDPWLAKYDATGRILWKRQPGTEKHELAGAVATDASGIVYLIVNLIGERSWMAKYSPDGHLLWKRPLGATEEEYMGVSGATTDAAGNVYLTGYKDIPFSDAWVAKYDETGRVLWERLFDEGYNFGPVYGEGVANDVWGNVYVTGWTVYNTPSADYKIDTWLLKYNDSGTLSWTRRLRVQGEEEDVAASSVATDRQNGNVYIAGYTDSSLAGPNRGYQDAWLAKYSTRP